MGKRTAITRDGLRHKKRTQTLSRGGYVPRYSGLVAEAGGKKTAFRHVRRRYEITPRGKSVFQIRIMRDDGVLIDEDRWGGTNVFWCRNASGQNFQPENLKYNDGYWSFGIPKAKADEGGYWIYFRYIEHSVPTVYPYRYRDADMFQESDLITPGTYEAAIPYWKVAYMHDQLNEMECDEDGYLIPNFISGVAQKTFQEPYDLSYIFFENSGGIYTEKINVKSSIPYQVHWWTFDSYNDIRTRRAREAWHTHVTDHHGIIECREIYELIHHTTTVETCCWPIEDGPESRCGFKKREGGPFTLKANNINLTITDDPIPSLSDKVEFEGSMGGRDHIATLSGGNPDEDIPPICQEGIWPLFWAGQAWCCFHCCFHGGNHPYEYTQWYPGVYNCMGINVRYDHY